jgi:hypothetical protein
MMPKGTGRNEMKTCRSVVFPIAMIVVLLALAAPASASIQVYSNFGPGWSYGNGGWWFGPAGDYHGYVATSFVPAQSGMLDEIAAAWSGSASSVNGLLQLLDQRPDNPAATVLWSQSFTVLNNVGVTHLTDINGIQLVAGTTYWLLADATNGTVGWMQNTQGVLDEFGFRYTGPGQSGTWTFRANTPLYENVTVYVGIDEGNPTVPEPSAIVLWSLLGLCGIGAGCWRRRQAAIEGKVDRDGRPIARCQPRRPWPTHVRTAVLAIIARDCPR